MREHQLGIASAKRGSGKTYTTLDVQIKDALSGNSGKKAKQKVLIMDSNNEYGDVRGDHKNPTFPHVKPIRFEHVGQWTRKGPVEARRVSIMKPKEPDGSGGGKMSLEEFRFALNVILDTFRNGLLVLEDLTRYVTDAMPGDLLGSIVTQRHVAVDTIIHFQTIGKAAHPQLWGNCNWLRMHKCEDNVENKRKNLGEAHAKPLFILEKMIDMNYYGDGVPKNEYFYGYYSKDTGKIFGDQFDQKMFTMAIERYLADNMKMVNNEINRVELRSGKKIHSDRNAAIDHLIKFYLDKHYGNPDYAPTLRDAHPKKIVR